MVESTLSTSPRYIATVKNSREIILFGTADLQFWTRKLKPENLSPAERDGQSQVMIAAVESRWLGVRFCEFLVAVLTETNQKQGAMPSYYLVAAYNTSRAFTFIEQRYFQTPYQHAEIEVHLTSHHSEIKLRRRSAELILASQQLPGTAPPVSTDWEGVIYLPPRYPNVSKLFYARMGGLTQIRPFQSGQDQLHLTPTPTDPVMGWLLESQFAGFEWHTRNAATHSRSETFDRD